MFTFCSISSDKLPTFSKVSCVIPASHSERKSPLRGRRVGRQISGTAFKAKRLCPLPHRAVEITVGTCTESELQLQAYVHGSQSGARRQRDWHRVPPPSDPASLKPQAAAVVSQTSCILCPTCSSNIINFPF